MNVRPASPPTTSPAPHLLEVSLSAVFSREQSYQEPIAHKLSRRVCGDPWENGHARLSKARLWVTSVEAATVGVLFVLPGIQASR